MSNLQKLSVFGLGKLGACMAATFAQKGFDVLGVDINAEAVGKINAGEPPVDEPRLAETMAAARSRLRASTKVQDAVETDASFFIVPSPSLPDGSFSNEFLMRAVQPLAKAVQIAGKKNHLFHYQFHHHAGFLPAGFHSDGRATDRWCLRQRFWVLL